jgi:hypothetical protein
MNSIAYFLRALADKWFCKHDWKLKRSKEGYVYNYQLWCCEKCGKFKNTEV